MKVPFLNLRAQYQDLKNELDTEILECLDKGEFVSGSRVREFENAFSEFLGVKHFCACSNGTDALYLILKALKIGPDDDVIVPANSFIATAEAVSMTGATPIFSDVDPETLLIGSEQILAVLTGKSKVVIPVHLFGMPANMDDINTMANKHGLVVVGDAAQAHGSRLKGQDIAQFCFASGYSFYPGKNLGAYGEAGGIATDNEVLAETVNILSNHGRVGKAMHRFPGSNMRMDEIQGAVLKTKLPHLDEWNKKRQRLAAEYSKLLKGVGDLLLPHEDGNRENSYHLYVIRTSMRDELQVYLEDHGVSTGIHYPLPIPLQPAYADSGIKSTDIPVCADMAGRILSLPIFPEMSSEQQEYVVATIVSFFNNV